jgi:Baseplate J-like protein
MPLSAPNLDDRTFEQLLEEARRRLRQSCPEWTDLSPSDPGMVLLELFAHLTEVMIYRLNRLPEKAYVEFLRLLGVKITPPSAAGVALRFTLSRAQESAVEIPRGTRVTLERPGAGAEAPVFVTARTAVIKPGATEADALAYHCDMIEAEAAGTGTGLPGQSVTARRPPVVAPGVEGLDLTVGVRAEPGELSARARALEHGGQPYRIWREVESFTDLGSDRFVYVVDRATGTVTFAPAVQLTSEAGELGRAAETLAEVPAAGREIRLWYCRGGGSEGNVAANTLTKFKDPIPGVSVTNPEAATGGRPAETLQNVLLRGPQELHSLRRAVTAHDFELAAEQSSGAVARARAFTQAALWEHAAPGTVEVLLVPFLPMEMRLARQVTAENLKRQETDEARLRVAETLNERRPLGTTCLVNWVRYKMVGVKARAVVHRGENPDAVRARVLDRLHQTINPLPTPLNSTGWRFGQPVRVSDVYDIMLAESGVSYVDRVSLIVDEVPEKRVRALAADAFQPRTWYAGAGPLVHRSLNDGDGWEVAGRFPHEEIDAVKVHPARPGLLAASARFTGGTAGSKVYLSEDCGETWRTAAETAFTVEDMAWMTREGVPVLLLATDLGLYELAVATGASPLQVLVDPSNQQLGFYAITTGRGVRGAVNVAVAARGAGGIFLSKESGKPRTFTNIGLHGQDVRVLEVRQDGPHSYLWAGAYAAGNEPGKGCFSWQLRAESDPPEGWVGYARNWKGGSCRALAFQGSRVLAGTFSAGVLVLDTSEREPRWIAPEIESRLPTRDVGRFHPVEALAANPQGTLAMAGGPEGIYRSTDGGVRYEPSSRREFTDKVALPETWLFCSWQHEITVVGEDEAE